jgi:DNA-directed RNA polymerase beta subunit
MFHSKIFLPDLLEIQRQGFFYLLEKGIVEEIQKRNPITNVEKQIEIFFYPEHYRLTKPFYSIEQAIFFKKSYVSKFYVPVQFTDRKKKRIFLKWILLAHLPLMTNRGHFVLNGSPRVLLHQLVRSPGIYFRENVHEVYTSKWSEKPMTSFRRFYADIICLKGTWLRIESEKDFTLWAKMKKGPKIPLLWFLLGMGLNEKYIFNSVAKPTQFFESFTKEIQKLQKSNSSKEPKYPYVSTSKQAWEQIQKLLKLKRTLSKSVVLVSSTKKTMITSQSRNRGMNSSGEKSLEPLVSSGTKAFPDAKSESVFVDGHEKKGTKLFREHNEQSKKKVLQKIESFDLGRRWFFQRFMNPKMYDLGKQGRWSINKKLGLTIPIEQTTLTAFDVLYATDRLMKMQENDFDVDDIDHLKNKRVRSSGECLQEIFSLGLFRLEKYIRFKLNSSNKQNTRLSTLSGTTLRDVRSNLLIRSLEAPEDFPQTPEASQLFFDVDFEVQDQQSLRSVPSSQKRGAKQEKDEGNEVVQSFSKNAFFGNSLPRGQQNTSVFHLQSFLNTRPINGAFREFFGTHPLSQFMDQMNPLAEITHKRRLTSLGPGGVSRDTATLAIRGIHPSHYGRICPIETPEGKNTGLVNSLTTYAKLSFEGFLKSPFYKISKGQIQKNSGVFFLDPQQEERFRIATPDLKFTPLNFFPKSSLPVRVGKRFLRMKPRTLALVGVSPLQMISVATSFIPFLEHDDANRALMGSNMQRQAVPLLRPERPFLGTGLEARVISDSGHAVFAKKSGYVLSSSGSKIFVYTFSEKKFHESFAKF